MTDGISVQANIFNAALHKPTTSSSTRQGLGASNLAVDGNTNQIFRGKSCTHTHLDQRGLSYWEVDLGASHWILYIRIYNRRDCCAERLSNVRISTSNDHITYQQFAYHEGQMGSIENVYPEMDWTTGRWVKIALDQRGVLTLCEVEVMSRTYLPKSRFETIPSARASGSILYSVKTVDVFECLSFCRRFDQCYSVEVDQMSTPYVKCTLFDSEVYNTTGEENVQFIIVRI